ncbi:DUF2316 family protein [Listeria fleischmannii]|jgi:hypothetical protein|uniref:DUF2316 family protein n=1 Tax=Listeria fleischmannii TaxID=1069827 RepID=UPI0004AFC322|nr:DUF2316 family protein [Listeria fleischmannii]
MSLTNEQITATIQELNANLVKSGLTKEQIAQDLKTNIEKINRILSLSQHSLEDPWILKEYLDEKIKEQGDVPIPFSALSGDYHKHWFLNAKKIDKKQLSKGKF